MSKKPKKKSANHSHNQNPNQAGLHKVWRAWVVVILMLTGIAIYVLSGDEAIRPGGEAGGEGDGIAVPAAE